MWRSVSSAEMLPRFPQHQSSSSNKVVQKSGQSFKEVLENVQRLGSVDVAVEVEKRQRSFERMRTF